MSGAFKKPKVPPPPPAGKEYMANNFNSYTLIDYAVKPNLVSTFFFKACFFPFL